jgi:ACT domain-containing protein
MFQANHQTSEKQAARAHKRYLRQRAKGTLVVDEIAKSGLSRSAFYRMKKLKETVPEIEEMIADAVAEDFATVPEPQPTPAIVDEIDDEEIEAAAFRLQIIPPQEVYKMNKSGKLQLKNHSWTLV